MISINSRNILEPQPSFHIEFTREMSVPSHPIPFHDGSDTKVLRETPKDVARETHVKCNIQKCTIEKNTVSKLGRCSAPVKEGISWGSPLISWSLKMHEFGCFGFSGAYWKARCEWDRKDVSVVPIANHTKNVANYWVWQKTKTRCMYFLSFIALAY